MTVLGRNVGADLCRAFGLDPLKIRRLDLHFPSDAIVTATVEYMPTKGEADAALDLLKTYDLVERETQENSLMKPKGCA